MNSRLPLIILAGIALAPALLSRSSSAEKPAPSREAVGEMVRLETDVSKAITQGDTSGCGPVSLLNMLKLGPEPYRKAYAKISDGDDRRALARLVDRYCSKSDGDGKARYSHKTGIDDPNLSRLCDAVADDSRLGAIETLYATRAQDESSSAFARRINDALVRSLSRGVPVVMSIDSYGEREEKWTKLTGHYMLFTGVQRIGRTNPSSFLVEYVDPASGECRQALAYAGKRKHAGAYAHLKQGDRWLKDDPYLCMASPYTDLRQTELGKGARHEFFLTILFGSFGK